MYSEGRLRELNQKIPVLFKEDKPRAAWRKVFRGLWVRLCQFPERLYWRFLRSYIVAHYQDPAGIKWPHDPQELLPHEDPHINSYAYLVDWFASAYGWSERQVRRVKWAAVNEYILAAEYRRVKERADLANATNLSDESHKLISAYPRRDVPLTGEERAYINFVRHEQRRAAMAVDRARAGSGAQ